MRAAGIPLQRAPQARLLVVDAAGDLHEAPRARLADFLNPGDVLVANDAATLPASLAGVHARTGGAIEVRLAGRRSLAVDDVREFTAVVFGDGDFRTRTEDRPPPPELHAGDRLALGPLNATVLRLLGHPRLVALRFEGDVDAIWAGIARHGRPIQYAHVPSPLALWDVWTRGRQACPLREAARDDSGRCGTDDRSPCHWPCGTSGHAWPHCPWRSSRRPPASFSTGRCYRR